MKKLLLLLFSLMLSFNSYGEWTELWKSDDGETVFIAFDRLIVKDEYVFSWLMTSNDKTSQQEYLQSDCDLIRMKSIQSTSYDQPLGGGEGTPLKEESWEYLAPESTGEFLVEMFCRLAKETPDEKEKSIEKLINLIKELTPLNANLDRAIEQQKSIELKAEISASELAEEKAKAVAYQKLLLEEIKAEQELANLLILEDQLNTLRSAYVNNISARIKTFWRYQSAEDDWTCEVYVVQDRQGQVKAVDVRNCNVGDSARAKSFRDSIERAVYKASPLPAAPDNAVFDSEIYMLFSVN
jgi:hypothetical protein